MLEKVVLKFLTKTNTHINRPTLFIHDILDILLEFQNICSHQFIVSNIIPSISKLLLCPNHIVRDKAHSTLDAFVLVLLNKFQNELISNDIYYDVETQNDAKYPSAFEMNSFVQKSNAHNEKNLLIHSSLTQDLNVYYFFLLFNLYS